MITSPLCAVAAIGTALGDEFFATETAASFAAVAAFNCDRNFVYKHIPGLPGIIFLNQKKSPAVMTGLE